MLSLIIILYGIGMMFAMRKWKKCNLWYCKILLRSYKIVFPFLIITWSALFTVVNQIDTAYSQQQIDTLTEVNKQMENLIEIIKDELSDNPELLNHVEEYLNEEINSNNEEISRCIGLQKDRVIPYRWWLYFR